MIPVVLVTHGDFAKGLIESSEMLVGKSEDLSYVTLEPSDDFSAFKQKIENEIKAVDSSDGVLLLADLLGGSPYNAAAMCIDGVHTECLTGLNLSMLLTALDQREFCGLAELAQECKEAAASNIVIVSEQLAQAACEDEDDE